MQFTHAAVMAAVAAITLASGSPARSEDVWHATRALLPGDVIRPDDIVAHPMPRPLPEAVLADRDIVGTANQAACRGRPAADRARCRTAHRGAGEHAGRRACGPAAR